MGTKTFLLLSISSGILLGQCAIAADLSGRTADGCTYKVINGQYLTTCPGRKSAAAPAQTRPTQPLIRDRVHSVSAAAVTDYDSVPMRYNSAASAPALPPPQHSMALNQPISAIEPDNAPAAASGAQESHGPGFLDQPYVGLNLGASNMTQTNAGSALGFGLVLGTNIDETFGIEVGYAYASQNLNLGLAPQGTSVDPTNNGGAPTFGPTSDSSLSTNLFTGELKANLLDPSFRLRPYLGAGLGWRSATLTENIDPLNNLNGGSLHQNALVGLGSVGTTFRVAKQVNLALAFNYLLPLIRPAANLAQPIAVPNGSPATTALSSDDDLFTGSSQYQVLGGLQYTF